MSFSDKLETRFGDEVLLHYGVKGMTWKEKKEEEKEDASSKKQGYKTEGRTQSTNVEDKRKTSASDADKSEVQWNKDVTRTVEGMILKEKRVAQAKKKAATNKSLAVKKQEALKSTKRVNSTSGKIDKILRKVKEKVVIAKNKNDRKKRINKKMDKLFKHSFDSTLQSTTSDYWNKSSISNDEVLLHYGIKGQKWGVTRRSKRAKAKKVTEAPMTEAQRKKKESDFWKALAKEIQNDPNFTNPKETKKVKKTKKVIEAPMTEAQRKKKESDFWKALAKEIQNDPNFTNHSALQHHGIKGMRWGVRNSRRSSSKAVTTAKKTIPTKPVNLKNPVNRLKAEIASSKREASWSKKATSDMSNRDLTRLSKRIQLENNLKGLVGKKEYLVRADVSTKDLKARVDRLQLQKNLRLQSSIANKANRDRADAIVKSVSNVTVDMITKKSPNLKAAIQKEMTNVTVDKISKKTKIPKDILDAAVKSVQGEYASAKAEAAANAPPKTEKATKDKTTTKTKTKATTSTTKTEDSKTYTGKVYKTVDDLKKRKRP